MADRPVRRTLSALAVRIAVVTTAVAVVVVLIAGLVSLGLVRSAAEEQSRDALGRQADVAQQLIDATPKHPQRTLKALRKQGQDITVARLLPSGVLRGDRLARLAVEPKLEAVRRGEKLRYSTTMTGRTWYVEVRPLLSGGSVILAQPAATGSGLVGSVVGRTLVALLVGLAVAVLAGGLLAWRMAAPLKRAAVAARQLASGRRDVRVVPEGPTEVAEVAESLNVLADALAQSEGRQRDFLLSISHELRTPLTAVKGFAEALADGVATGDAAQLAGRTIVSESDRLERLVADLLDLARLGAQDFQVEPARVDLADLMRRAADVWATRCEAVGVVFRAELPAEAVPVITDPARARQIIDGLAENALRVTPADRPIVFALRREGGYAVLEVRDGGPGLTPDDCAVAFQRSVLYERYRGVRRVGTGVGLALVHGLATRLGGAASAGRAREGGACFAIRLPL
ncbi:MAG: HAMP domain-containing protein [Streptosporangiales bacterium]|nr:HAMP domain-containing protein [Streptosporangiales bacterium]